MDSLISGPIPVDVCPQHIVTRSGRDKSCTISRNERDGVITLKDRQQLVPMQVWKLSTLAPFCAEKAAVGLAVA